MKIAIYENRRAEIEKMLAGIKRKAEKYGVRFAYEFGESYAKEIRVYEIVNNEAVKRGSYKVAAVDVEIDADELIKKGGWTVCARIEHGDKGNIVDAICGEACEEWYAMPQRCEHCGTNRQRNVTFVVEKNGEYKQVGKACLKDYTGIDPNTAIMFANIADCEYLADEMSAEEYERGGYSKFIMHDARAYLAAAYDDYKARGFRPVSDIDCTAEGAWKRYKNDDISAAGLDAADKMIEWLAEINTGVGIERDCAAIARSGYFRRGSHGNKLAAIPMIWEREQERKKREAERAAAKEREKASEYIGNVGERIDVKTRSMRLVSSWDTQFGTTYLYKFEDESGNVLVWFASAGQEVKEMPIVRGTIKAHTERDSVKQTVITRCKIVNA